jgi:hypothetical protein
MKEKKRLRNHNKHSLNIENRHNILELGKFSLLLDSQSRCSGVKHYDELLSLEFYH